MVQWARIEDAIVLIAWAFVTSAPALLLLDLRGARLEIRVFSLLSSPDTP